MLGEHVAGAIATLSFFYLWIVGNKADVALGHSLEGDSATITTSILIGAAALAISAFYLGNKTK